VCLCVCVCVCECVVGQFSVIILCSLECTRACDYVLGSYIKINAHTEKQWLYSHNDQCTAIMINAHTGNAMHAQP